METQGESMGALSESLQRLESRLEALASALAGIEERDGEIRRIAATVENSREAELEKKLEAAEQQIAELRAQIETKASTRKTVPASTAQFLSRQGLALENVEAGALDAALSGLSLEQRIAVKAQLLRAGVVNQG